MNLDDPALLKRAAQVVARSGHAKRAYAGNAGGGYYSTVGLNPYQRYQARMYRDPRLMFRDPAGRPAQEWGEGLGQAVGETLRGVPRMLTAPFEGAFRGHYMPPGYFTGHDNMSGLGAVTDDLGNAMLSGLNGDWSRAGVNTMHALHDANPFGSGVMGNRTREAMASGIRDLGGIKRYWNDPTSFWNGASRTAEAAADNFRPALAKMPGLLKPKM